MLTWLRLYNSPERVTSSRVEIPGLFFCFAPSLFSPILLEGWGGGCSYCGFVRLQVAEAGPPGDLWKHLQDAKPLYTILIIQRAMAALEIKKRWSDGVWHGFMESVLGFTLMATRVNILYDRGISAAPCFLASSGVSNKQALFFVILWSCDPTVYKFSPSLKNNLWVIEMFETQTNRQEEQKLFPTATSRWICVSTVGNLGVKVSVTSHTESSLYFSTDKACLMPQHAQWFVKDRQQSPSRFPELHNRNNHFWKPPVAIQYNKHLSARHHIWQ